MNHMPYEAFTFFFLTPKLKEQQIMLHKYNLN